MAQALARFLAAPDDRDRRRRSVPLFAGVWAIFGHGNVAGMGEALYRVRDELPTYRAHNEQAMAHAAIAFAKASRRRRMMACTTSIGPGATNMVTAAAVAHVNRLPVLLLPATSSPTAGPIPVLQQIEDFGDGTVSANDCFRPVSRYFDRITRPEQIIPALDARHDGADRSGRLRAGDAGACARTCRPRPSTIPRASSRSASGRRAGRARSRASLRKRSRRAASARRSRSIIARRRRALLRGRARARRLLPRRIGIPVGETQAGKSRAARRPSAQHGRGRRHRHRRRQRAGRGGRCDPRGRHAAAGLHHRLLGAVQERRSGDRSASTCRPSTRQASARCRWSAMRGRARGARPRRSAAGRRRARWTDERQRRPRPDGSRPPRRYTAPTNARAAVRRPGDRRGAARVRRRGHRRLRRRRTAGRTAQAVAGGRARLGYHLEYGYSCMGYEIAGGLGVKMARPDREVVVMLGDGSYLMMNSEIATSVMLGLKLIIVVLDNRGFGCINRLQTGDRRRAASTICCATRAMRCCRRSTSPPMPRASARIARRSTSIADLETAFESARKTTESHQRDRHRHRSAGIDGRRRPLVGCRRAGSLQRQEVEARRATTRRAG